MKSVIKLFAWFALGILFFSCDDFCLEGQGPVVTRELSLETITGFSYSGSGNVYVYKGEEQEIIIEGQSNIIDRLESHVVGGHWDIDFDGCISNMSEVSIYVTVPELEYISLRGSGKIAGFTELENFDHLDINLSGSGRIDLDVYATSVDTDITGSGNVRISGDASRQKVKITGSGEYQGYGIEVNTADLNISGSGNAEVHVMDELDVVIHGSGNVIYRGNPEVSANITGSGNVIKN